MRGNNSPADCCTRNVNLSAAPRGWLILLPSGQQASPPRDNLLTIRVELMEAPSAILASRLQQMVRGVPFEAAAPLTEEPKSWGTSVKWLADVPSEVISRPFLRKCWRLPVFAFIEACRICSLALAGLHNFFISTTVQRVENEAQQTDFLSSCLFAKFAFDKLILLSCKLSDTLLQTGWNRLRVVLWPQQGISAYSGF